MLRFLRFIYAPYYWWHRWRTPKLLRHLIGEEVQGVDRRHTIIGLRRNLVILDPVPKE